MPRIFPIHTKCSPTSSCLIGRIPRSPICHRPIQIGSLTVVRFNSTGSSPTTTTPLPLVDDFTTSSDIQEAFDEASKYIAPDSIGYLKSLGLDYGFGPTSAVQSLLETVHTFSGMPWWGTIIASVLLVRAVQFPFYCRMSSNSARLKELNPLLAPLTAQMQAASRRKERQEMMECRNKIQDMVAVSGVDHRWHLFPFSQIPIFYGFYRCLRGMAELPVPGLQNDGFAWFTDLTVADPTWIIPACASALIGVQIAVGGEAGQSTMARSTKTGLMLVLPMISFGVAYSWPAVISFYLLSNTAFGILQNMLLRNPAAREYLGLYPLSVNPVKSPITIKPVNVTAESEPEVKQIGGAGGFLDKLTGGHDEAGSSMSVKDWKESFAEKSKEKIHQKYEESRKKRLEEQKRQQELERERKRRLKNTRES